MEGKKTKLKVKVENSQEKSEQPLIQENAVKEKKENVFSTIFNILKQGKKNFFILLIISLLFYSFLYGLWKIPIVNFGINRLSNIGISDYLFVFVISLLISFFFSLFLYERKEKLRSESYFGGFSGGFVALISGVCPVCQSIALVAFGSTLLSIPTTFLTPYLGFLKFSSVVLLGLAVYFKADSIYTKTCKTVSISTLIGTVKSKKDPAIFRSNFLFSAITLLVILLSINQIMIPKAFAFVQAGTTGTVNIGNFEYGPKITLKPMPLAVGEQPKISGYKTKVKSLPTISELSITPLTGDAVQDLLNNVIPKGTPWYGQEAGVSFDDPIKAQNLWAKGRSIQLDAQQEERWKRIVNSFSCDYCCGSPQNPTIITRCGCAHAAAAQGMAKWFIKYYGDKYSDEGIYGEMARWYALWYPKGTIERIIQEAQ
ncbi:MAG: hypothetical protein AABX08_00295 [Nanoarchaeota archaeon]